MELVIETSFWYSEMFGFHYIMLVAMFSAASSCTNVHTVAATVRLNMPSFDICAILF
jgi:hypothetical protein